MKKLHGLFLWLILFPLITNAQSTFTYEPGSGITWISEDSLSKFRILGYIQSRYDLAFSYDEGFPNNGFDIRRARLDVGFTYKDTYRAFFELDAAYNGTALVLAFLDIEYWENHTVRFGKFITRFSGENYRSSRSLSTIERYSALNSLFLLPALDTQFGVMLFAVYPLFEYYFSITNGNGKASANLPENNDAKEFTLRLVYQIVQSLQAGVSFDYTIEEPQPLSLVDHKFKPFNTLTVSGRRFGYLGSITYRKNDWLLRGEAFKISFLDPLSPVNQAEGFWGGYLELGYFISGNYYEGFQFITRYECAEYLDPSASVTGTTLLHSFLLGFNWFKAGLFRLRTNLIYEYANRASTLNPMRLSGADSALLVLTELQIKF